MKRSPTTQLNGNGRNGRSRGNEADACYAAALNLVEAIDRDLQRGTRHYYSASGRLLVSLDEVIEAILNDELIIDRPAGNRREKDTIQWAPVQELATSTAQVVA